jgi:ribosomal protein L40E
MAKKSLGYVELEWHCPSCGTRNSGLQKTCKNCGLPQPDDVEFVQPGQEKFISDEAKLEQVKSGPDIHCYYCGARNPAMATACSQCGADLSEGARRRHGQVLGAHRDKPAQKVTCPACGTLNEPDAEKCVQCGASLIEAAPPVKPKAEPAAAKPATSKLGLWGIIGIAALALVVVACLAVFFLFSQTDDIQGTVDGVSWSRSIVVEGLAPVTREDWYDEIPDDAVVGTCTQEVRRTQDEPAANSKEVCGTPYTVDTGTGAGEVVQDCEYQVYEDFCEYTVEEWQEIETEVIDGTGFSPQWPSLALTADEREGERTETYEIVFNTEDGQQTYTTTDENLFNQAQIGSRWLLKVNAFNTVTDIEPLN